MMQDEQIYFIETMIQKHKDASGQTKWKPFRESVFGGDYEKENATYNLCISLDLIKLIDKDTKTTVLLPDGWKFTTYKEFDKKATLLEDAKYSKAWQEKYWWLISLIAFLLGILTQYLPMLFQ